MHYVDDIMLFGQDKQYVASLLKVLVKPVLQIWKDELCEVTGSLDSV